MEQELKFALAEMDPLLLEKQLARTPVIGRRKPRRQLLHSTYYDTPDHALQRARVALRVRQTGDTDHPHWVQTLKMGGTADSAFSSRGEWEETLKTHTLNSAMLANTPWVELDPDGEMFASLAPVFTTRFERLSWVVSHGDCRVEVALDRGNVLMDGLSAPLCELELELLQGSVHALFEVAEQISQHLALLPLHLSKAVRAYRLAQGTLYAPLRARPPVLTPDMALQQVAQTVLRETFLQFSANLYSLRSSAAPEVLHQTRVGWRRFKSALQILDIPAGQDCSFPALTPLKPLLAALTALRDLEVTASEVLPSYAQAYQGGEPRRLRHWQRLEQAMAQALQEQRDTALQALADPAVGRTLLHITRWLETGATAPAGGQEPDAAVAAQPAAKWLRKRVAKLAKQLKSTPRHTPDPALQHRLRILSKRLRYNVESLRALLPKKRAGRWLHTAIQYQTRIGLERDRQLAVQIAQKLHAADGITEFLRGAAFGSSANHAQDQQPE